MRDAHNDRNSVPLYAMGEDGLALRRAWLAGYDERDEQIRRKRGWLSSSWGRGCGWLDLHRESFQLVQKERFT